MGDSSGDSVSINMESTSFVGKVHIVKTGRGSVSVAVFGDLDKPALITYPDLGLNYMSCFQGLFFCPEAYSLLMHNFCIYHINPPGHELGAVAASPDDPILSVDDLADQISDVLDHFGLGPVMCMGVTAGAYILTLFAIKYPQRVKGLILVSPLCRTPSWSEWLRNKVMSNLLYFCGMCGLATELLLKRYFSTEVRGSAEVPESDIVQACRRLLAERRSTNVLRFLEAMNWRSDITNGIRGIKCHTLIFVGEYSPFHSESMHMISKLDKRLSALVEVQACGSIVTEEHPDVMLIPMECFLMRYGCYRPPQNNVSPRSPLSPRTRFLPELFSPESMGLKLKPIKTRMTLEV